MTAATTYPVSDLAVARAARADAAARLDDAQRTLRRLAEQTEPDVGLLLESVAAELCSIGGALAARPAGRRAGRTARRLDVADLSVDSRARIARVGQRELDLTYQEFQLLRAFLEHRGTVLSRPQLMRHAWDGPARSGRTVDVHVARLRTKLGARADLITTVRNVGYRFG